MTDRERKILQIWRWIQRGESTHSTPFSMHLGSENPLRISTLGAHWGWEPLPRKSWFADIVKKHLHTTLRDPRVQAYTDLLNEVAPQWVQWVEQHRLPWNYTVPRTEWLDRWRVRLPQEIQQGVPLDVRMQWARYSKALLTIHSLIHGRSHKIVKFGFRLLLPDSVEITAYITQPGRPMIYQNWLICFTGLHIRSAFMWEGSDHFPRMPGMSPNASHHLSWVLNSRSQRAKQEWWTIHGNLIWMGKRGKQVRQTPNLDLVLTDFEALLTRPTQVVWDREAGLLHIEGDEDLKVPRDITRLLAVWVGHLRHSLPDKSWKSLYYEWMRPGTRLPS